MIVETGTGTEKSVRRRTSARLRLTPGPGATGGLEETPPGEVQAAAKEGKVGEAHSPHEAHPLLYLPTVSLISHKTMR
jgi:hypothetical protein